MTPPGTDPSTWFNIPPRPPATFCDPFLKYGGKDARIRVIFPVPKKLQSNPNGLYVFPTSRGKEGEKQLSPFNLGPCRLYGSLRAKRMENAWQYSKVWPRHVGEDGEPTAEYFEWARKGWSSWKAERYPMGKAADRTAAFHWWDGQHLDYIEASNTMSQ